MSSYRLRWRSYRDLRLVRCSRSFWQCGRSDARSLPRSFEATRGEELDEGSVGVEQLDEWVWPALTPLIERRQVEREGLLHDFAVLQERP